MPLNYGDQISPYSQDSTTPLAMRMMEHLPGITASLGFSSRRGSNTLIRGGYLDDISRVGRKRKAAKYGTFAKGELQATQVGQRGFLRGRKRNIVGKDPFVKQSLLNNTPRFRNIGRLHSTSVFTASEKSGFYTFAQGHRILNKMKFEGLRKAGGIPDNVSLFGPGTIAAISAGTKLDRLTAAGKLTGKSLDQVLLNIERLATANNPALLASTGTGKSIFESSKLALKGGGTAGARGVAGNLMASAMMGEGTRHIAGYFRGAQGFFGLAGLEGNALIRRPKCGSEHGKSAWTNWYNW